MSKDINFNQISVIGKSTLKKIQRYAGFILIMAVLLAYGFLVVRISALSQAEPSDEAVSEQLKAVKRLKIDQNSISKIEQLEDQNVGVQSLFESARDNPFQD